MQRTLTPSVIATAQSILDSPAQLDALTVDAAKVVRAVVDAYAPDVNPTGSEHHDRPRAGGDLCTCGEPSDPGYNHRYNGAPCFVYERSD